MATTVAYLKAGTASWTPPAGVTSVKVEVIGGGASGNYLNASGSSSARIVGGGGGEYRGGVFAVTPGENIPVQIGAKGVTPASGSTAGNPGGDTWFRSNATLLAKGGGATTNGLNAAAGGSGGTGGTVNFNGGGSPLPTNSGPSGGGGAGGPNGAGAAGGNSTQGTYPGGGGASNGGSPGQPDTASAAGAGGNNRLGAGGGAATGGAGSNGGGGGGNPNTGGVTGGAGSQDPVWTANNNEIAGPGSGGGGVRSNSGTQRGGPAGGYGGGGGGGRAGGGSGTDGLMVLTYEVADQPITANAENSIGPVTVMSAATAVVTAVATMMIGQITVTSSAAVRVQANADNSLGEITAMGMGGSYAHGIVDASIGDVTMTSSAVASVRATASPSVGEVTITSAARSRVSGQADASIGEITAMGMGGPLAGGLVNASIGEVTMAAAAVVPVHAASASGIGEVTISATALALVSAAALASVGEVTLAAQGEVTQLQGRPTPLEPISAEVNATIGEIRLNSRLRKSFLPVDEGKSAQRVVDETLVTAMDQVRTLLEAESIFIRGLNLGELPLHERRMIGEVHQRVRAARDYAGTTISRLIRRLDPYGDQYTFRPSDPIQVTPGGIIPRTTGFCNYQDNETIQEVASDTMTIVVNNRPVSMETQKPADVETFFRDNRIRVGLNDAVAIRVQMMVRPTDESNIASVGRIGLSVNDTTIIFPQQIVFNGFGQLVSVSYATTAYAAATWAANGAAVVFQADGPVEIVSRTLFVTRLHKGR